MCCLVLVFGWCVVDSWLLLGLAGLHVISVFVMIGSWMQLVGFSWSTCNLSVCDDRQLDAACWV